MPKRMTLMEMYATAWFAITFAQTTDVYLSLRFDLYGYSFNEEIDPRSIIPIFGVFSTYNAIFLNFFPKKKLKQVLYIFGHTVFIVTYEWIAIKVGAFHHNDWKLTYSAMAYPFVLLILYLNIRLLRFLKGKEGKKK